MPPGSWPIAFSASRIVSHPCRLQPLPETGIFAYDEALSPAWGFPALPRAGLSPRHDILARVTQIPELTLLCANAYLYICFPPPTLPLGTGLSPFDCQTGVAVGGSWVVYAAHGVLTETCPGTGPLKEGSNSLVPPRSLAFRATS